MDYLHSGTALKHNIIGPCQHRPEIDRCTTCIFDSSDFFAGLNIEPKEVVQQALELHRFRKHDLLYTEGAPSTNIYLLVSGEIKIYKTLPNGRQQILKLAMIPGDLLGCEDLFLERHNSSAEVIENAKIGCINKTFLRQTMLHHMQVYDVMMQAMARDLNAYIRHITNLGQKNAQEKVASYLLYLHHTHVARNQCTWKITESLTRADLADMLGITQRTLIRSLKSLENKSIISLSGRTFTILDLPALSHISMGNDLA